jgi:hypothetical protein
MLSFYSNTLHLKVDKNIWKKAKKRSGTGDNYDDTSVVNNLLKQNQRNHKTIEKLKKRLDENHELYLRSKSENAQLLDELKTLELEIVNMKENETIYKNIRKRDKRLETDYKKLKSKYEDLKNNPIIQEKIVYKTDEKVVHELHEKNEKLRVKLWEKGQLIDSLNNELKKLKEKLAIVEDWKLKKYGMILKVIPKEQELTDFDFESEFINLSEYNMWLRNKREFLQSKNIESPVHIITIGKDLL